MKRLLISICFWATACTATTNPTTTPRVELSEPEVQIIYDPTLTPSPVITPSVVSVSPSPAPTNTPSVQNSIDTDPADWKDWPVIPNVDRSLQKVYEHGLSLGNDPQTFSLFGDCQARPDEFFGVFETDPTTLLFLSPEMRETVKIFEGSFDRESSTAQDGTTPGALLWIQWHRGEYGCTFAETPVECELRTHRPSFVIIQIGTHFESRNTEYLRKIILQLLDEGVVPILATKADNREKDERINRDMALLASEYDLPLWNFWAAVSNLPNRGLYTRSDRPLQGDIYLTDEAAQIHRNTGLEALSVVWRAVTGK
jgi:hypothetical protein